MNDLTYGKVLAEYNMVRDTDFWKLFIANIAKKRQTKKDEIVFSRESSVHEIRGYIYGLNFILGRDDALECPALAASILKELRGEVVKENE